MGSQAKEAPAPSQLHLATVSSLADSTKVTIQLRVKGEAIINKRGQFVLTKTVQGQMVTHSLHLSIPNTLATKIPSASNHLLTSWSKLIQVL